MPSDHSRESTSGKTKKRAASRSPHRQSHEQQGSGSSKKIQHLPSRPKASSPEPRLINLKCPGHTFFPNYHMDDKLEAAFRQCGPCQTTLDLVQQGAVMHNLLDKDELIMNAFIEHKKVMQHSKDHDIPLNAHAYCFVPQLNEDNTKRWIKKIARSNTLGPVFLDFLLKNAAPVSTTALIKIIDELTNEVATITEEVGECPPSFKRLMELASRDSPRLLHHYVEQCTTALKAPEIEPKSMDRERSEEGITLFRPRCKLTWPANIPAMSITLLMDRYKDTFEITTKNNHKVTFNKELMKLRSPYFKDHLKHHGTKKYKSDPFPESERVLQFIKKYAKTQPGYFDWKPTFKVREILLPDANANSKERNALLDKFSEILAAAHKFQMQDLLNDLQNEILHYSHFLIRPSNVEKVEEFANKSKAEALESYCKVFISKNERLI